MNRVTPVYGCYRCSGTVMVFYTRSVSALSHSAIVVGAFAKYVKDFWRILVDTHLGESEDLDHHRRTEVGNTNEIVVAGYVVRIGLSHTGETCVPSGNGTGIWRYVGNVSCFGLLGRGAAGEFDAPLAYPNFLGVSVV